MSAAERDEFADVYRPPHRTDSAQMTERLLEGAAEEFFAHGYEGARVRAIARRSGVTTGAIYARWHSKSDLMTAAVNHILFKVLPEQRLKSFGAAGLRPHDMIAVLGASLVAPNDLRDVMVQLFGSARNSEAIRACLREFLDQEASQLSHIIELAKDEGLCDPELSTTSLSLLCQAIGIGTDLLLTGELDERHIPSGDEWSVLVARLIAAVQPPGSTARGMPGLTDHDERPVTEPG